MESLFPLAVEDATLSGSVPLDHESFVSESAAKGQQWDHLTVWLKEPGHLADELEPEHVDERLIAFVEQTLR